MSTHSYSDSFRVTTFRATPFKTAIIDGHYPWHVGDSVILTVSNIPGAEVSSLHAAVYARDKACLTSPATGWREDPENPGTFYSALDLGSSALDSALEDTPSGEPFSARLYISDANTTWVDMSIRVLPSPHRAPGWPDPADPYPKASEVVLKADLRTGLAPILGMPTLNAAQREARLQALLDLLNAIAL